MVLQIDDAKSSYSTLMLALRVGVTLAFFFWFYIIWNSTSELDQKLSVITSQYSAIDDLQIDFKNEIQEWKDVLLRSNSKETLENNWRKYETQYLKVVSEAQDTKLKSDISAVKDKLQSFVDAHKVNHEKYKEGVELFIRSGYNPRQADSAVNGIDRALFDTLEAADSVMQAEKKRINEDLTAKSRKQVEQSILSLVFLVLFAVWMPRK